MTLLPGHMHLGVDKKTKVRGKNDSEGGLPRTSEEDAGGGIVTKGCGRMVTKYLVSQSQIYPSARSALYVLFE